MNPEELLKQLRGIHEPAPPSWWPLGIGWWLSLTLLLLIVVAAIYTTRWRIRSTACRRMARLQLKKLVADYEHHQRKGDLARNLAELIKRVLLARNNRSDVASLTQSRLIELLAIDNNRFAVSHELRQFLETSVYQKEADFDETALINEIRAWIKGL